ncbi:unnamed protein product [Durusdinium trenchii]|uniref:Uncharacterized protein n=1 Tax=Durusdinium trenchii TaxID=1381693 RepID=A0ABP0PIA0_9DINO
MEPMAEPMALRQARASPRTLTLPRPEVSVPIRRHYSKVDVSDLEPRLLVLEQNVGKNADLCAKIEGFFERVTARVDAIESNQLSKDILLDLQAKIRDIEEKEWEKDTHQEAKDTHQEATETIAKRMSEWKITMAKHKEELDATLKVTMTQHKKELDRAVLRLNERFETMTKDLASLKSTSMTSFFQSTQQILDLKTMLATHGQELQELKNFRDLREGWLETFEKKLADMEDSVAYSEKVHVESCHALRAHVGSLQAEVEDRLQEVWLFHDDLGGRVGKVEQYLSRPFHLEPSQAYGEPTTSEPQSPLRIPVSRDVGDKSAATSQPFDLSEPRTPDASGRNARRGELR